MSIGSQSSDNSSSQAGHNIGFGSSSSTGIQLGQQSSSGSTSSYSSSTPGFMTELGTILNNTLNGKTGFTKQDAINDVQGVLNTTANDALMKSLPSILRTNRSAGLYDSTTQMQLENDLGSRINAQLAGIAADTIKDYAGLENSRISAFSDATRAGTQTTSGSSGSQSSTGSNIGLNVSDSINLSEALSSGQSSGSSDGWNFGLPSGKADGGEVTEQDILNTSKNNPFMIFSDLFDPMNPRESIASFFQSRRDSKTATPTTSEVETGTGSDDPAVNKFLENAGFKDVQTARDEIQRAAKMNAIWEMPGIREIMTLTQKKEFADLIPDVSSQLFGFAADGSTGLGQSPQQPNLLRQLFGSSNMFEGTRGSREAAAGLNENSAGQPQQGAVVINVNTSGGQPQNQSQQQPANRDPLQMLRQLMGFADGGQIHDSTNLLRAMMQHQDGGQVRHIEDDAATGGKIKGPQSKSGRDNQLVAVAGGEGVLPVDVMQVPGVPELVQGLIQKYHKPVK